MFFVLQWPVHCKFTGPHFLAENIVASMPLDKLSKIKI